jgi:hypothetical protein
MPRNKQEEFEAPGFERPDAIPEIEAAAELYAEKRDSRQEILREEVILKNNLLSLMHTHGRTEYSFGDTEIKIDTKEKVKVKIKGGDQSEEEMEEELEEA